MVRNPPFFLLSKDNQSNSQDAFGQNNNNPEMKPKKFKTQNILQHIYNKWSSLLIPAPSVHADELGMKRVSFPSAK